MKDSMSTINGQGKRAQQFTKRALPPAYPTGPFRKFSPWGMFSSLCPVWTRAAHSGVR
jgi:hypothetical protein